MFARIYSAFFFLLFALPLLASAASVAPRWNQECDTGSLNCCQSTESASSLNSVLGLGLILELLGVVVGDLTGEVGITCSGILSSASCTAQPVCCSNVVSSSLIGINCSPINVGL